MNKSLTCGLVKSINDEGIIDGYAAVFNNIDRQNETILPGAFTETLDDFVKSGHLIADHEWSRRLGTIEYAKEDSRGLYFTAKFYTTAFAQEMKKQIRERLARGKQVALSIGYKVLGDAFRKDGVRELSRLGLYEVSLVSVPANPLATVLSVKGLDRQQHLDAYMLVAARGREESMERLQQHYRENAITDIRQRVRATAIADLRRRVVR